MVAWLTVTQFSLAGGPDTFIAAQMWSVTFDSDNTERREMTLVCRTGDFNPASALTYSWTGRCQGNMGSTCHLGPHAPDNDTTFVTCAVINLHNAQRWSNTFDLGFTYLT